MCIPILTKVFFPRSLPVGCSLLCLFLQNIGRCVCMLTSFDSLKKKKHLLLLVFALALPHESVNLLSMFVTHFFIE